MSVYVPVISHTYNYQPDFSFVFFSTLQYATIPLTCRAVALRVESSYHASFVAT